MSSEPRFGDWLRGIHASESNPHRDGMYVRTIRRTGRVMNPGKFYELTNGKGDFWSYPAASTERINPLEAGQRAAVPEPKYPCDGSGDEDAYNLGWNDCRAAMFSAAPTDAAQERDDAGAQRSRARSRERSP